MSLMFLKQLEVSSVLGTKLGLPAHMMLEEEFSPWVLPLFLGNIYILRSLLVAQIFVRLF